MPLEIQGIFFLFQAFPVVRLLPRLWHGAVLHRPPVVPDPQRLRAVRPGPPPPSRPGLRQRPVRLPRRQGRRTPLCHLRPAGAGGGRVRETRFCETVPRVSFNFFPSTARPPCQAPSTCCCCCPTRRSPPLWPRSLQCSSSWPWWPPPPTPS